MRSYSDLVQYTNCKILNWYHFNRKFWGGDEKQTSCQKFQSGMTTCWIYTNLSISRLYNFKVWVLRYLSSWARSRITVHFFKYFHIGGWLLEYTIPTVCHLCCMCALEIFLYRPIYIYAYVLASHKKICQHPHLIAWQHGFSSTHCILHTSGLSGALPWKSAYLGVPPRLRTTVLYPSYRS